MKRLAMVLTVAFTMGLAASTVSASTVSDNNKKTEKKECCSKDKKECCAKDKKATSSVKKEEAPAKK